jgi:hypothetical protein
MKSLRRLLVLSIVPIAGCLWLVSSLLGPVGGHPPDADLIRRFHEQKKDFESLLTMIQQDKGLQRVDDTWTSPERPSEIGVSDDRIEAYRRMFAKLGIPRGFDASKRIIFLASTQGLSVSGSAKGYAYLYSPPESSELLLPSLDDCTQGRGDSFTAYRHIQDGWYLYFDYED